MGRHTRFARTSTKRCQNQQDTYLAEGSAYHESAFQTRTQPKADQTIFEAHIHNHMPPNLQADLGMYRPKVKETREQHAKPMQYE